MNLKLPPPPICFTGNPVRVVLWHDYPYATYSPRNTLDPLASQGPNLSLDEFIEGPFSEYVLRAVCGAQVFDQGRPVLEESFECEYDLQPFLRQAAAPIELPDMEAAHGAIALHSLPEFTLGAFVAFYRDKHSAITYFDDTFKAMAGSIDPALQRKLEAEGKTWFEANPESFVTLQPNPGHMAQSQVQKLYFMLSDDPPAQIRLRTRVKPADGLPYFIYSEPVNAQPGRLAEITINLGEVEDTLEWVSVQLVDGAGEPLSELRRYNVSQGPTLQLIFRNSLGAFDALTLFKPAPATSTAESDYFGDSHTPARQLGKDAITATPPPLTAAMRKYLEELKTSTEVYKTEDGALIRVNVGQQALAAFAESDTVHNIELTIESVYNEKYAGHV